MKYITLLIISLFAFKANANALSDSQSKPNQNVSQQTGGNYIYAENGKLIFNLEPSLFENRKWQFNNQADGAVTGFETKLPIKTKNSSSFHAYELAMGYHVYEYAADTGELKFVRATTEKPPKGGLMHPVYTPRIDKGRTYHVWLPAAVWTVRVIGSVARAVVPPIITRCLTNSKCRSIGTVVAVHICAINYSWGEDGSEGFLHYLGLPESFCAKAKEKGWQQSGTNSTTGEPNSMSRNYAYTVTVTYGSYDLHQKCPECANDYRQEKFGADSVAEAEAMLNKKCKSITTYTDKVENSQWYLLSGTVKKIELNKYIDGSYSCSGVAIDDEYNEDFVISPFTASIENSSFTENMQIHDINDLILEDFKKDPTPYINDNGQVGKELRDNIKSSAAIQKTDGTSGTINATSEPYIDPETGTVKQDILTVDSGTSDFTLPPMSGGGSGGSGNSTGTGETNGIPTGTNNVNVSTIDRPDLSSEAKPAENNNPNGTGTGTGTNSVGTSGENKPNAASNVAGLDCEKHKGTLACAGMGDVDANQSFEIPKTNDSTTWKKENLLPSTGVCPAPKPFTFFDKSYELSYTALCRFSEMIRYIVIALAALAAGYIIFAGRKD